MDKKALGKKYTRPKFFGDEIWKFEIALRKHEYYLNSGKNKFVCKWYQFKHHRLGIKLGFSIPCNVFGGLRINHYGLVVVNPAARIGDYCDVHQGVNIGVNTDGKAPTIGDNVWIGPGAKIFGGIVIGDEIMIGANSVVNKDFKESNYIIAGVPAVKVSDKGNVYKRK